MRTQIFMLNVHEFIRIPFLPSILFEQYHFRGFDYGNKVIQSKTSMEVQRSLWKACFDHGIVKTNLRKQ